MIYSDVVTPLFVTLVYDSKEVEKSDGVHSRSCVYYVFVPVLLKQNGKFPSPTVSNLVLPHFSPFPFFGNYKM